MGSSREIYRSAMQLIEEEGDAAAEAAQMMASVMRARGNTELAGVWNRILAAVNDMMKDRSASQAILH